MEAFKCDKCGEFKTEGPENIIKTHGLITEKHLCFNCGIKLNRWLKRKK